MFDKLSAIESKYEQMMVEMAEPAVQADIGEVPQPLEGGRGDAAAGRTIPRVQGRRRADQRDRGAR